MITENQNIPTKQALLNEGMAQLARHGYHGTGLKQVLDAVQVPKGSFYNYFSSKQAYVAEIIAEYSRQSLLQLDEFIANTQATPGEQLRALYQAMLDKVAQTDCQSGCLVGSLGAEIGHELPLCQKEMLAAIEQWQLRIASLVEAAQAAGDIRSDVPARDIADLLWGQWEGAMLIANISGTVDDAKQRMDTYFKQLLKP